MAKCVLCSKRAAKRYCPAKSEKICSVCCGTKREVEIDCPSDCVYLKTGRSFEAARDRQVGTPAPLPRFDQQLLYRNTTVINGVAQTILEERRRNPAMVDQDVRSALEALKATMKTLSSGIYYETLPKGAPLANVIYRRIKSVLDALMQPQARVGGDALRVSDVPEALAFILSTLESRTSGRPRSRQYLDWLATVAPEPVTDDRNQLILP
jgi:hypothetical protein